MAIEMEGSWEEIAAHGAELAGHRVRVTALDTTNNMNSVNPFQTFIGIDHPAFATADSDGLAEWYCEVLGYTRYFRLERAAHSPRPVHILRAADGTLLEIMPEDNTRRPERTTWTPGWSHLALRVSDFEAASAYLESKGVEWSGPEVEATGGGRLRSFTDPDGNMLQIVWRGSW